MIEFLQGMAEETPFLLRGPGEFRMRREEERIFLQNKLQDPRSALLVALVDGVLAGTADLRPAGSSRKCLHRSTMGISVRAAFQGRGIGTLLMHALLESAEHIGCEQVELEVLSQNEKAISLYEKCGFRKYSLLPRFVKYPDGTYDSAWWMVRFL